MSDAFRNYQVRLPIQDVNGIKLPVLGFSLGSAFEGKVPLKEQYKRRNYYFLGWVRRGSIEARIENKRLQLTAGQAIVLPSMTTSGFVSPRPCQRYQLKFAGTAVSAVLEGLGIEVGRPLQAGPPPTAVFTRLYRALSDVRPRGEIEASGCTYEILARLAIQQTGTGTSTLVEKALAVIEADWPDEDLNVSSLARRLGVHRTLLAQRFGAEVALPPSAYLREVRVRQALSLLEGSTIPVTEVARRCGCPDSTQFSRLIRRETGRSPREIRAGE